MQDKVHPTILLMKLKHHSCSVDAACVSTCCLSQIPEPNKSVNHEKITRLLANDFHSSKKDSKRLPEIGNSVLFSGTLFITFGTELQAEHREALFWHLLGDRSWKFILRVCGVHRYSFTRTHIGSLANYWLLWSKISEWMKEDLLCKSCNHKGFMFLMKAVGKWYFLKMFGGNPWSSLLPLGNAYALLTEAWLRLMPEGICLEDYKLNRRSNGTWIL